MFQFPSYDATGNKVGFIALTLEEAVEEARQHWQASSYGWGLYSSHLPWQLAQVQEYLGETAYAAAIRQPT